MTRHDRPPSSLLRAWAAFLALACFSLNSYALTTVDSGFDRFRANILAPGKIGLFAGPQPGSVNVSNGVATLVTANGPVNLSRPVGITTPSGKSLQVTAKAAMTPAAVARIISLGMRATPLLVVGSGLYAIADQLGYGFTGSGDDLAVTYEDPSVCTVGPCYSYRAGTGGVLGFGYGSSAMSACSAWVAAANTYDASVGSNYNRQAHSSTTETQCRWTGTAWGTVQSTSITKLSAAPASSNVVPSTLSNFEQSLRNIATWSEVSRINDAVAEAAKAAPVTFQPDEIAITATGPAVTPVKTSTTISPSGVVTTETTEDRHTYSGPEITTTTVTVTSTYNPTTNITDNSTTTTTIAASPAPAEEAAETEDPCTTSPDRLGCLKAGDAPSAESLPNRVITMTVDPVAFASSSGCPAPMPFSVMGKSYSISYQPTCDALAMLKAVLLVIAGFMAAYILADSFRLQT